MKSFGWLFVCLFLVVAPALLNADAERLQMQI